MSICPHCNFELRNPDTQPDRGFVRCPDCGKYYSIPTFPFFVITGGGGCGKTTVTLDLVGRLDACLVIEVDDYGLIRGSFETSKSKMHVARLLHAPYQKTGRASSMRLRITGGAAAPVATLPSTQPGLPQPKTPTTPQPGSRTTETLDI